VFHQDPPVEVTNMALVCVYFILDLLSFYPGGRLVSRSFTKTMLWDLRSEKRLACLDNDSSP
jgi:hypothetical protein